MSAEPRQFGFETRMLHAGHIPDPYTGARAVPIYQTTSFVFDDPDYAAQLWGAPTAVAVSTSVCALFAVALAIQKEARALR